MATETVTTSDYSDYWLSLWKESWDREIKASCQSFFIWFHRGLLTNSIMLSQTAADVHAFFEAFLRSHGLMVKVMGRIVERGNYHHVSTFLDYLRRSLDSEDGDCIRAIILRGERAVEGLYKKETCDGAFPSENSQHAFTVAVAAVLHLLAFVLQYLIGYIDRGGTKTYSSGCFDFRASFVSVLLFLAAFVWIKFRQAARPPTGKRKARSTQLDHPGDDSYDPSRICVRESVSKFEARFTIPREKRDTANPVKYARLSLGLHKTREEAAFVSRVAQSYYENQRGACCVNIGGDQFEFFVPAMSEQERCLVGEEKKDWVVIQAKDVGKKMYEEYAKLQLAVATGAGSSNPSTSLSFQPSLMRGQTADEPLHVLDFPSCPGLPCEGTVREVLNPGSPPFQEQHQGPAAQEGPVTSEGVEADSEFTEMEIDDMIAVFQLNSESAPVSENDTLPYFGVKADAVEHGRPEPLPQGIIGAGDAVLYSTGFGPTVIERSESLDLSQQYQQPQAYGVQELHQLQVSESQNPRLQQVHCMPSQQNSGRLQEVEPSEQVSACEQCEPLREENKRLREEVQRLRVENERFKSMFHTVCNVVAGNSN